jgi:hypothetical protein
MKNHLHLYIWTNNCHSPNSQQEIFFYFYFLNDHENENFKPLLSKSNKICTILLQDLILKKVFAIVRVKML